MKNEMSHDSPWIDPVDNLLAYFHEEFSQAAQETGVETSEFTRAYIIHMLDGFTRLTPEMSEELGFTRPAAVMLSDAAYSGGEQRIEAYRRLGDACLYNCGFFAKRLTRRGIKASYYERIGRSAYQDLGHLMRGKRTGGVFTQIFGELADTFDGVVATLRRMGRTRDQEARASSVILTPSWG